MTAALQAQAELIPGYRLLEPLGRGGLGEVWKCEAPGGLIKAVKFVRGSDDSAGCSASREFQSLQRVKALRHPFLLSLERIEVVDGGLVLVMELADGSLADWLAEQRAAGQPGIPRDELIGYLREAAEVLDLMSREHGLQHLDVKPRNLLLVGRHVKVADFGLVSTLAHLPEDRRGAKPESLTPLYAAPERFEGRVTPFCDQYSLAVTYHELLTGALPFESSSFFQLALQHAEDEPDLRRLPESDRPVLARALAKAPTARFPTCAEFVKALAIAGGRRAADRASPGTERGERSTGGSAPAPANPQTSLLDGYRFLECLARTPVAELWRTLAPDGRKRLVKYAFNFTLPDGSVPGNPAERLRTLKHPGLVPTEVVEGPNRLALVTDEWEDTLASRLKECQKAGLPGIPRPELLAYLGEVAECLDALREAEDLPHLGLTPRHVAIEKGAAQVADFGLVAALWLPAGHAPGALNPRYSAPEVFDGPANSTCDSYSLALIYQEMLTGRHAFRNLSQRATPGARLRARPDLSQLSGTACSVIARALDPNPKQRFATCGELVSALTTGTKETKICLAPKPVVLTAAAPLPLPRTGSSLSATPPLTPSALPRVPPAPLEQLLDELIRSAAGSSQIQEFHNVRYVLRPGEAIEHHCFGRLLPGTLDLKLEGFRRHWQALKPAAAKDASTGSLLAPTGERSFVFQVLLPGNLWDRLLGKAPSLEIEVSLPQGSVETADLTELLVKIRPVGCSPKKAAEVLQDVAPLLLESVRNYLQPHTERRRQERLAFEQSVRLLPVYEDRQPSEAIVSQAEDVSTGGMKLFLPCRPPSLEVAVQLPRPSTGLVTLPARIVHLQPCRDGRFEAGLSFLR